MSKADRFASRIDAALAEWCSAPFSWGASDCLLSLGDIVQTVCGYDPCEPWRGRYRSRLGAMRVTRGFGFDGALESAAIAHVWKRVEPSRARVGDVGILKGVGNVRCGVIRYRGGLWVGRTETGFSAVRSDLVDKAWRVA